MHKPFYASGFLFHLPSQQILLQQLTTDNETKLTLFRELSNNGEKPQSVFRHCIETTLGISIPESSIYPVYDYIHETLGEHFIFYADIVNLEKISAKEKTKCIVLAKLSKFKMNEQTRHDIIIGERVIRSRFEGPRVTPQTL